MKKNIVVIYSDRFPNGGAGANRHLSITKGLVELGNLVEVHLIRPTENKEFHGSNPIEGSYEGVKFIYTSGTNIWKPRNKITQLFLIWIGIFNSLKRLLCLKKDLGVQIVISGFSSYSWNLLYYVICKLLRVKFIYHIDEYPWMVIYPEKYSKLYTWFYLSRFYKLFDGIIVISHSLATYYSKLKRSSATVFHLPMTVDSTRFHDILSKQKDTFDILYAGSMCSYKDGVNMLINAFAIFSNNISGKRETRLLLVGKNDDEGLKKEYNDIIAHNNLEQNVLFIGEKHRDEIPELLCNADVLALARPNSIQAEGGFPTKLGEYLLTKKPVIITNVGEIKEFLIDGVSAYISEPNEICFSKKLEEVYENYDKARLVGLEGYKVAMQNFEYKDQIKKFDSYLNDTIYGSIFNNK